MYPLTTPTARGAGALFGAALFACTPQTPEIPRADPETSKQEVFATERAFAASMAQRDFATFDALLSEEAIFLAGSRILRGKAEIGGAWKRFFEGPTPPFSWEPQVVEVLPSGSLSWSTGPVHDPSGLQVGTYSSVWRKEADGKWRIIFDTGNDVCRCQEPAPAP